MGASRAVLACPAAVVHLLNIGAAAPELVYNRGMASCRSPVQSGAPSQVRAVHLALWVTGQHCNDLDPALPGCCLKRRQALHGASKPLIPIPIKMHAAPLRYFNFTLKTCSTI